MGQELRSKFFASAPASAVVKSGNSVATTTASTIGDGAELAAAGGNVSKASTVVADGAELAGQAVAGSTKVAMPLGKAVFTGVAGGVSVVAGAVEMGFAIYQLKKGSPTQNQMKEMLDVVKKTQEVGHLMPKKKAAVDRAVEELEELYAAITEYVEAINGTKIGGATTSAVGGGLCIAGIFFPPLLVPGLIVGGVGAATAITTTIVELSVQHKNYMIEILEKLQESGVVIVYNNTISNDLVRTTNSKID